MPEKQKTFTLFLSAAEPSADIHCAGLITALKKTTYNFHFIGVGGPKMARAGCDLLQTTTEKAAILHNAFAHCLYFYKLIKRITTFFKSTPVDLVIVCDSPAFNFHIAKAAQKAAIPACFYVAPQLWAWGRWRIGKLRKYCRKLWCILPFEENFFRRRRLDAAFIGNPLLDDLPPDLSRFRKSYTDFDPKTVHLALMPGSRNAEINALWPAMQKITTRIKKSCPNLRCTTVAVDAPRKKTLQAAQLPDFTCDYSLGNVTETARAADLALVASGSATLQTAAMGCPMIVMYQSSRIAWNLLGRWLLKTKHLSLVNILAERRLVPEFMPYFNHIEPIVDTCLQLLHNRDKLARLSTELVNIAQPLSARKAGEHVAADVLQILGIESKQHLPPLLHD